jgi:hypothetical protein
MRANLENILQKWTNARLNKSAVFWLILVAIIVTLYLGFSSGSWVTAGGAERLAQAASQAAVVDRMAPICLLQFNQDPDKAEKLAEMLALSSTSRWATYVKQQGWATMPGEDTPDNAIATGCVELLILEYQ